MRSNLKEKEVAYVMIRKNRALPYEFDNTHRSNQELLEKKGAWSYQILHLWITSCQKLQLQIWGEPHEILQEKLASRSPSVLSRLIRISLILSLFRLIPLRTPLRLLPIRTPLRLLPISIPLRLRLSLRFPLARETLWPSPQKTTILCPWSQWHANVWRDT